MVSLRGRRNKEVLLADVLGACLDALEAGTDPEDVIALHPEAADEVAPLLDIVQMLRETREPIYGQFVPRRIPRSLRRQVRLRWRSVEA